MKSTLRTKNFSCKLNSRGVMFATVEEPCLSPRYNRYNKLWVHLDRLNFLEEIMLATPFNFFRSISLTLFLLKSMHKVSNNYLRMTMQQFNCTIVSMHIERAYLRRRLSIN